MQTKTLSLHHIIKEPTIKKDKTPVLFMFHGYGSDENDLFSFAEELPEELFIISVRAPYPMQPFGNAWYAIYFDASRGYLNEDILKEGYEKNDFSKIKIYCSHGSVDQVIPVDWARKAPIKLNELGIQTTLNEFPVGHGVAPQNFYQFKEWLSHKI